MALLVLLFLFITIISASSSSPPPPPHLHFIGIVARLTHRSSPESPFFDPNLTYEDVIIQGAHSSSTHHPQNLGALSLESAPISFDYTIGYAIGTPPVMTYATPHTRSDLIWLQCKPCLHCFNQDHTPVFDPRRSSTYTQIPCATPRCQSVTWTTCTEIEDNSCYYEISYEDGRLSSGGYEISYEDGRLSSGGIISTETFSFVATPDSTALISFPNITFGCGDFNEDPMKKRIPGVMGLQNATNSFVGQLNLKSFSYCVSKDTSGNYNGWIRFGSATLVAYL